MLGQLFNPPSNPTFGIGKQISQLDPRGSHIISPIPLDNEYYNKHLKLIEDQANNHVQAQLDKFKAYYDVKEQELNQLTTEANEVITFATEAARLNFEWYYDLIFMKSIAMNLELRQAKAKIQAEANEKVEAWQATAEALLSENEGLRAKVGRYEELVKELKRAKKPERILNLLAKFEE